MKYYGTQQCVCINLRIVFSSLSSLFNGQNDELNPNFLSLPFAPYWRLFCLLYLCVCACVFVGVCLMKTEACLCDSQPRQISRETSLLIRRNRLLSRISCVEKAWLPLSLSFGNTPTAVFVVPIFALVKTQFVSHWSCNQRRMSTAVRSFFTVNLSRSRTIECDRMPTVYSFKLWDREWALPLDLTLTLSAELLHDWGYLLDWSGLSRAKVRTWNCIRSENKSKCVLVTIVLRFTSQMIYWIAMLEGHVLWERLSSMNEFHIHRSAYVVSGDCFSLFMFADVFSVLLLRCRPLCCSSILVLGCFYHLTEFSHHYNAHSSRRIDKKKILLWHFCSHRKPNDKQDGTGKRKKREE